MKKITKLLLSAAVGIISTSSVMALTPSHIYVFGDSLSDQGYQDILGYEINSLHKLKMTQLSWPMVKVNGKEVRKSATFTSPEMTDENGKTQLGMVWPQYLEQMYNIKIGVNNLDKIIDPNKKDTILGKTIFNMGVSGDHKLRDKTLGIKYKDGTNYAAGGAVTEGEGIGTKIPIGKKFYQLYGPPSLNQQIDQFEKDIAKNRHPAVTKNDVFIIWGGSNDVLKVYMERKADFLKAHTEIEWESYNSNYIKLKNASDTHDKLLAGLGILPENVYMQAHDETQWRAYINRHDSNALNRDKFITGIEYLLVRAADNVFADAKRLINKSHAKHVIIIGLPDIGKTPLATGDGDSEIMSHAALLFRMELILKINADKTAGAFITQQDTFFLLGDIMSKPTAYGFSAQQSISGADGAITEQACVTVKGDLFSQVSLTCMPSAKRMKGLVFEDMVHPTTQLHKIIAEHVKAKIDAMV